ncbi:hypothetical protein [Spirosoma radiotolerans]|uniref:DUF4304 domain-containing protein n=1 Tax=Spirosoma radiotolerans TaxID=1379870 RepID=A0A0E3ZWG6_9BACT|nr:hypothetical protein [Spirosoma radiotolerans]AKD55690.1 hypothetical protein SD10_13055 [Spirosoma radiotolerans]
MTSTSFETLLYQHLTPLFQRHQFVLLPEKRQYRNLTDAGFQTVMLFPTFYDHETILDVQLGCRNDQVEQIAQQFQTSQAISRPDANTLTAFITQFADYSSARFSIHSEKELLAVCDQIEQFFVSVGFDFLTASCALPAIDRLLNGQPEQLCPYVPNQMHRCYKGLIAASLNHNRHFKDLVDTYRHVFVQQTQNSYEQIRFERLIAFLQHYSAN